MREQFQTQMLFKVIVSIDNQYSLWLVDREIPPGWHDARRMQGSAMECLAYIREWYFQSRLNEAAPEPSPLSQPISPSKRAYA